MRENSSKERFLTLTDREKEVLQLVCKHKSYQEIADQLFIAKTTVKKHMFNVYNELGLHDKKKTERILAIHNVYCPMFSEVDEYVDDTEEIEKKDPIPEPEPFLPDEEEIIDVSPEPEPISPEGKEIIVITPEPEPLSPEEEEIIDGDEMALITYTPEPKYGGEEKMKPKKKRGGLKFSFVLILGVLLTIGAWQAWQYLKDIPIVSSIIELIDPGVTTETKSEASSETKSELSSIAEPIISSIKSSLGSSVETYEIGEWVNKDDVWVRLSDYEVTGTLIALDIEVWNKTGHEYFFSWNAEDNFSMVDNQNNKYEVAGGYLRKVNLDIGERMKIPGHSIGTIDFRNDPLYKSGVTDLYVTMEFFSTIDEAVFHIGLGN